MLDSQTQAPDVFRKHRRIWEQKAALRRVYREEFFSRLLAARRSGGTSIEVGSGPGFFKDIFPEVVTTDAVWSPWLNVVCDAQALPFQASSIANIFGLDILHHFAQPMSFLSEAERILASEGRLILVEPWVTPFSYLLYRYLHQEECDFLTQPSTTTGLRSPAGKDVMDGNIAVPNLLFGKRNRSRTLEALPKLRLLTIEPFCLFAYLLTCGFKPLNFLPGFLYGPISKLEKTTLPLWRRLAALRVLIVLEKRSS